MDDMVICPFEKSHIIRQSRIQYHLVKCAKNFPNHNKKVCPYNANEYIDPEDFPRHLLECKYQTTISGYLFNKYDPRSVGNQANVHKIDPSTNDPSCETDELWDIESNMKDISIQPIESGKKWNSVLTNKPIVSGKGRGILLKNYLDEINNQCDGVSCKKVCCSEGNEVKNIGSGGARKPKFLGQGRGKLLQNYLDEIHNQCDGVSCKKACCHEENEAKNIGRGGASKPKFLGQGRGKLLQNYLYELNNQCDGVSCKKVCCHEENEVKSIGRGGAL